MTRTVSYRWHLRQVMAQKNMFATTELGPLLAARGIVLSREQVYRLVTGTPEPVSYTHLFGARAGSSGLVPLARSRSAPHSARRIVDGFWQGCSLAPSEARLLVCSRSSRTSRPRV